MSKKTKADSVEMNNFLEVGEKINKLSDALNINVPAKNTEVIVKTNQKTLKAQKLSDQKSKLIAEISFSKIKVTQTGSSIGCKKDQEKTLIGLGLGKIGRSRILENSSSVNGMINKVKHLIVIEAA